MIYRNVRKHIRKDWHAVPAPNYLKREEASAWCRDQKSLSGFYYHYTNTRWWFESEKDAMLFSMKWSEHCPPQRRKLTATWSGGVTFSTGPR